MNCGDVRRSKTRNIMSELRFTMKDLDMYLYGQNAVLPVSEADTEPRQMTEQVCQGIPKYLTNSVDILQLRYEQGVEKEFCSTEEFNKVLHLIKGIPSQVQLCYSSIPGAGFGVCAKQSIVSGTWIGPYKGKLVSAEDVEKVTDTNHVWEVYQNGKTDHYIDGSDSRESTWMKYIQCARTTKEQNMTVFQFGADVYFQSNREIQVCEELLVWYADYYDQYLGIPIGVKKFANSKDIDEKVPRKMDIVIPNHPLHTTTQINQPGTPMKVEENSRKQCLQDLFPTLDSSLPSSTQVIPSVMPTPACVSSADTIPFLQPIITKAVSTAANYKHKETTLINQDIFSPNHAKPLQKRFWKCHQCLGRFPQKWALHVHNCPCETRQPYNCNQCSEMFIEKEDLQAHIKKCSRGAPYKCGKCKRAFAEINALTKHLTIHSGQKLIRIGKKRRGRISNYEKFVLQQQLQIQ